MDKDDDDDRVLGGQWNRERGKGGTVTLPVSVRKRENGLRVSPTKRDSGQCADGTGGVQRRPVSGKACMSQMGGQIWSG